MSTTELEIANYVLNYIRHQRQFICRDEYKPKWVLLGKYEYEHLKKWLNCFAYKEKENSHKLYCESIVGLEILQSDKEFGCQVIY